MEIFPNNNAPFWLCLGMLTWRILPPGDYPFIGGNYEIPIFNAS